MIEIKIPKIAESINEAYLARWYKRDGEVVQADTPILSLETDKISLEIKSPSQGTLKIIIPANQSVAVGTVVANILDEDQSKLKTNEPNLSDSYSTEKTKDISIQNNIASSNNLPLYSEKSQANILITPLAWRLLQIYNLNINQISGTGQYGKIIKNDVLSYIEKQANNKFSLATTTKPIIENEINNVTNLQSRPTDVSPKVTEQIKSFDALKKNSNLSEEVTRQKISPIRAKIAEHLLHAKQNTAMLTTFNEVDMTRVIEFRQQYKESFLQKYKTSLGFMPFFIKATIEALKIYPQLNAYLEDNEIIYHHYYHIGIAIGSERGLVVPVIRHADRLSFIELEQSIQAYTEKVKQNLLTLEDLTGGTFTISNGGVYGSLLSTPILNTPQIGILGMHKIQDRPIAWNGQVVIRPMMYLAMSYDHRMIDGRESVQFLKRIKECIENPERIMMEI